MAVVINSHQWEEHFDQEYDLVTTRIYLPCHYSTWHSRVMRDVLCRIMVGSGESTSMMDILEWRGRMQGTVPTMTVADEVLSHMG